MRAVRYDRYGPPDVLHVAEIPEPVVGAGEASVHIEAASLNPIDGKLRSGTLRFVPMFKSPPRTTGVDFAGVVVAVGDGDGDGPWRVGERVFGEAFDASDRTIDSHVKNLRHKLGTRPDGEPYVETVRGVGYRGARP